MAKSRLKSDMSMIDHVRGVESLQYDDAQYPCVPAELALAHRPPSEFFTQTVLALPTLCRMRALFYPRDQTGKCSEPKDGVDEVDDSVDIGVGKAAYALEDWESRLIDESRYTAPTLHTREFRVQCECSFEATYEGKIVPDPPIQLASLGEDGNGNGPGDKDGHGLARVYDILHSLVVMREGKHGKYLVYRSSLRWVRKKRRQVNVSSDVNWRWFSPGQCKYIL